MQIADHGSSSSEPTHRDKRRGVDQERPAGSRRRQCVEFAAAGPIIRASVERGGVQRHRVRQVCASPTSSEDEGSGASGASNAVMQP